MAVLDNPVGEGVVIATTDDAYDEMIVAQNAKDPQARVSLLSRLLRSGRILYFPNGTPVLVVNTGIFSVLVEVTEGEGAGRSGWVQRELARKGRPVRPAAEVEVESRQEPEVKDEPKPKPSPSAEEMQKAVEEVEADRVQRTRRADERRAAGLIRIGQNLEKSGKTKGALDTYRRIVKEFPGTPQAKASAARIKALGGE
jgi:hypothetical protein